jgi:hypothetical protein
MPPAWVNFCWVLVREKCDNVKQIYVIVIVNHACIECDYVTIVKILSSRDLVCAVWQPAFRRISGRHWHANVGFDFIA